MSTIEPEKKDEVYPRLSALLDRKLDIIISGLSMLLFVLLLTIVAKSLWGTIPESLWTVTGLVVVLLLILSKSQGTTVFLVIMAVSTMVADEEFLLEVMGVMRGESLGEVRQSRNYQNALSEGENEDDAKMQVKLGELMKTKKDSATIFKEVEAYRDELDIDRDINKLSKAAKHLLTIFAEEGSLETSILEVKMEDLGSRAEMDDSIEELIGSDYVALHQTEDRAQLTPKGVLLARKLGLTPSNQDW